MSDFNRDYFEALLAMGWFEPSFAEQFARNSAAHELLPASVQEKIRTTFFQLASEMSWAETARKHDDQLQQRVVDFFKASFQFRVGKLDLSRYGIGYD